MNSKPTILRHWLATLLAAVCILMGTQTAWAQEAPVTYQVTRTERSNTEFTFTQPSNNVEVTVEYVNAGVMITPSGENPTVLYYETLVDAIADCAAGDVITLLANQTLTATVNISKSLSLNLNGMTISKGGEAENLIGLDVTSTGALTITGSGTMSGFGTAIKNEGSLTLNATPTFSDNTVDIDLAENKVVAIGAAWAAPTSPIKVSVANALPYNLISGWANMAADADPASYFASTTAGVTIRKVEISPGVYDAQFVTYVELSETLKPTIANGGQDNDGERTASLAEGNVWVGDALTASTTATPDITWQWYRKNGTTETAIEGATAATYTLTADDVGYTIIAKATQPANIAGIGYPASDVVVASAATFPVVKKDNFGTLAAATIPVEDGKVDYVSVTITNASTGVQYMVVADGVTPTEAHWALATMPTANGNLTLNQFVKIDNEVAVLSNMLPTTSYDLYYRLVETATTKHGTTATTNGKPVNELKADITTKTFDYKVTTQGVTYKISEDPAATVTAAVTAIPTAGDGDHKTATILASIPADNAALIARLDVWKVLGYTLNDETTPTAFAAAIAVDANAFDSDMDLSAVGSTLGTYGYVKAMDDGMYAWLMSGTPQATCTEEGYQIYLMNGAYYAVCNASDEYAMAGKSKRIEETMSSVLTIDGLTGDDQGAVQFKDKTGTALPVSTVAPNTGKIVAAPGQKVTVEVTLPAGFGFKSDAAKVLNVTHGTTTNEITLADPETTGIWTAEFTMPTQNATVRFKEAEPLEGFAVTFDYTATTAGGAVAAATGSPTADGTVKVLQTLTYTLTPTTPAADAEGAGYALTALGLPDGITPTIVLASNEETAVTLPTEQSVKVTFTVPATYTTTSTVTFAPVFTNTYENISFAAGNTTYKYSETQGIALHGENADLTFCTVTGVSGSTVTTAEITSKQIPAGLPVIVQNTSGAAIVARMDIGTYDVVTYDDTHFKGTVEAKTTTDSSYGPWHWADNMKYYGFNGLGDFVWINEAGNVAAHKCWLMIQTGGTGGSLARQLSVVWPDGSTTRINGVNADDEDGDWYDLNGRKLQAKPQRKGVYILNGQKKVVK